MENFTYKPDIYEGKDPYIHVSYHESDKGHVMSILEKLDMRGFRFWLNDGIAPGMETDEIIAEHIESCDFFIAFLSEKYLGFQDTVDELNYSRDVNKEYLLIYLEDVSLPAGLDMRFMRSQSIMAYEMSTEDVFGQIVNINNANRFYGIADYSLRDKAEKLFEQLEKLYPEHKVFALDAVSKQVSKEISELYVKAGYPNAERLMLDYGFSHVNVDDARNLRNSVLYAPGFEPDIIKPRIDYIMGTLSSDYPDKVITDNLSKTHKSIYKSLLGISVWMGYDSAAEMLNAYGFTGVTSESGRIEIDHKNIIERLQERYENREKPTGFSVLQAENPDMKAHLKTLSNRSNELFGMTFRKYLKSIGLIAPVKKEEKPSVAAQRRELIIADIKKLYESEAAGYGSFEEAMEALGRIVVKKSSKGLVYVTDCNLCNDTMKIPYGVDLILREAFAGESDLIELVVPPTVKEIREGAFADCSGLKKLILSEGLERIDNNAFENCTSLKSVVFPASLKSIGNEAFAGCEELEDAEFKNLRTNIQQDAFDGCIYEIEELQDAEASPAEYFELKVERNNNAKIIAYNGDEDVVVIPKMIGGHPIVSIEKGCFKGNEYVKEIYISDYITAVNGDAFKDCKNLEKVYMSNAVSKFTGTLFSGCSSLAEVNIPDNMTEIPRGLFKDAPLTTIYIGKNVKNISPDAFYKGDADFATGMYFKKKVLENLIVDANNETFSAVGSTLFSKDGKILFAELGDPIKVEVPEGVEEIAAMAYEKLSSLDEIRLPSTLKKIGEKAFAGTNLRYVEIPESVEEIGTQAFSYCRNLSGVDFYDGLKVIGQQAFEGCPISDVYIPASVKSLGNDSFLAISTYQGEISQRFRVDSANENIFADAVALYQKSGDQLTLVKAYNACLRLKPGQEGEPLNYTVTENTTAIAPHAFARCNNLAWVELPEGLLSIGDMAFWDCNKLTEVHIPESCKTVSPKAFFGIKVNMI